VLAQSRPSNHAYLKRARSRIGNGSALLPHCDGRSIWARHMRDTYAALITHMGGEGYCSVTQKMQARRVATIESELIFIEDYLATQRKNGEEPAAHFLDLYVRLSNSQRRHAEVIGWRPHQRDVTPSLATVLEQHAQRKVGEGPGSDGRAVVSECIDISCDSDIPEDSGDV
jgi:hypothetical protein